MGASGRLSALWMLQAGTGDSIYPLLPRPVGNFDESADQQPFKYLVDLVLRHPRRAPYLRGIGCILSRDHRQHPFLVARQPGRFVIGACDEPKGVLRLRKTYMSLGVQLDQKLGNALMGHPKFFDDLAS